MDSVPSLGQAEDGRMTKTLLVVGAIGLAVYLFNANRKQSKFIRGLGN